MALVEFILCRIIAYFCWFIFQLELLI